MARVDPDMLSALPGLYAELMERPRTPMVRGMLPFEDALYVFYQQDEPILTGSMPYLDLPSLLYPSYRGSISILVAREISDQSPFSNMRRRVTSIGPSSRAPVEARWLRIDSPTERMLLEIFTAQKLGITVTHPKIINALPRSGTIPLHEVSL